LFAISARFANGDRHAEPRRGAKVSTTTPSFVTATAKYVVLPDQAISQEDEKPLAPAADKIPAANLKKVEADKITSFFVRANDSKRIQFSMLVAFKTDLAEAVRQMLGEK
jgi:hypothetical protein